MSRKAGGFGDLGIGGLGVDWEGLRWSPCVAIVVCATIVEIDIKNKNPNSKVFNSTSLASLLLFTNLVCHL